MTSAFIGDLAITLGLCLWIRGSWALGTGCAENLIFIFLP
jgi:hypothetical protein